MSDQDPVLSMPLEGDPDATHAPAEAPLGRPSWSGLLHVGLLAILIKAYPALVCAPPLPAHLLHAGCGQRLHYDKCCPRHGKLDATAIVKGYEYAPGQFLVLDESELEHLRPARDRALTLDNFIDLEQIDPLLYAGRSLYLAPAGAAPAAAYTVLAKVLYTRRQEALSRLVLSGRRHVALRQEIAPMPTPFSSVALAHLQASSSPSCCQGYSRMAACVFATSNVRIVVKTPSRI